MAKILVIDDDSELLNMTHTLLERAGPHEAMLSADGAEGLALALADPPDLAIIDLMMPGLDGYEICRRLRANPSTASIPLLVLTSRGQAVDRQAALHAGADAHVTKPVAMNELLEQINGLLAKRAAPEHPLLTGTAVLLSLRGGVGVTTLAVNLAAALAQAGDHAVSLLDLCPSSGHAALQLGLRPEPTWSDLLHHTAVDAETLEAHFLEHPSGLRMLASPVTPLKAQEVNGSIVEAMLGILQERFTATVVDAPPVLNEAAMAAVEAASVVGLVVTAESPSIQTAIGTLRALKEWSNRLQIILNRTNPDSESPVEGLGRVLGRPVMTVIPFDQAQAEALARGVPLVLENPDSPLAQGVQELAQDLGRAARRAAVSR